jgi:hypothetical protein
MTLRSLAAALAIGLTSLIYAAPAAAFCGFYVAKADTKLFNDASKVVLARDGQRTVITMSSDYRGSPKEFAMVVPVVSIPQREQINVANPALIDHIDAYTSPRLVEYFDENPCEAQFERRMKMSAPEPIAESSAGRADSAKALGVTIEAEYEVGEYDILILSAKQSNGLITWLTQNGYKIPKGADSTVNAYLNRGMKFFIAKVNLDRHDGSSMLRPIQVAYEDEDFMLPIRLGTVNAQGKQELFIFALTRNGRVETKNYRTVKLPSDMDVPIFVKDEFGDFYRDMFQHQVKKESGRAVFMEYAWDMAWCDPCAADPLSHSELKELGVMWLDEGYQDLPPPRSMLGRPGRPAPSIMPPGGGAADVFVTRLHVSYDAKTFPEDLDFQVTGDRENYQGRYVLRHAWRGDYNQCQAARDYANGLVKRWDEEAITLARLTGRDVNAIRSKMTRLGFSAKAVSAAKAPVKSGQTAEPWWKKLWNKDQ